MMRISLVLTTILVMACTSQTPDEPAEDAPLALHLMGSLSGVVVDLNGRPVLETELRIDTLTVIRGSNSSGRYTATLNEDGRFTIGDLPPGRYGVYVDSCPGCTGIRVAQTEIDLGPGEHVEGIELSFDYARYLSGR